MPRLSIVIACCDDADTFETTLASVLQHRPDDCEVIVVHPFMYPDPYELSGEVRFVDGGRRAATIDLLNAGLAASRGEVVHFLEPGTQVEEGWTELPLRAFQRQQVAAAAPLVVLPDDRSRVAYSGVRRGLAGRRRLSGVRRAVASGKFAGGRYEVDASAPEGADFVGPSRHAAFYRRAALAQLGGFDHEVGETAADIDLALNLRRLGYQCLLIPECRIIGSLPESPAPVCFAVGRGDERVYWRNVTPEKRLAALLLHPVAAAAELLANVTHRGAIGNLCGRFVAFFELSGYRRFHRRMDRSRTALASAQGTADDLDAGPLPPSRDAHPPQGSASQDLQTRALRNQAA